MLCHAACMLDMNPPINLRYIEVTCECTADLWLLTDTLELIEINQVNRIQQGICLNKDSFIKLCLHCICFFNMNHDTLKHALLHETNT